MTSLTPSAAVKAALAPKGKINVGLNHSNSLFLNPGSSHENPNGIAPDIAQELNKLLNVRVDFLGYDAQSKLADLVTTGAWSVTFLAAHPPACNWGSRKGN